MNQTIADLESVPAAHVVLLEILDRWLELHKPHARD